VELKQTKLFKNYMYILRGFSNRSALCFDFELCEISFFPKM